MVVIIIDTHRCTNDCVESRNTERCKLYDKENIGKPFRMICNLGYRVRFIPIIEGG